MEALFLKLVNMSITASWLVLAIITVRLVFRKTPKWILCLLWGLVAVRLICPFSIESALSLIPNPEPLPQDMIYTAHPQLQSGIIIIDNTVNPMLESSMTPIEPASANPTQIWSFVLSQVWILGMVLMLLYTVISYLLLKRKVATAIPLGKGIKQCEFIDSPFVLGLVRPIVYLPFGMAEADMAYVIAHEKAHLRRKDHWWKPLGFLLLSIYWFNPVLWVAYILLCRDIEAACDEKVIKDMEKDERRAYSTALLNCSIHRRRIAACPLAFGETGVKTRVKSVMNYKKPAFWVILIALFVSIVVAVCFLTNPKSEEADTSGYGLIQAVTSQDGYVIVGQESTKINLVIEKAKLPDVCFTLKGHTFEPKEIIPYQTFADNKLYLKHVGIDEERSEYLRFTFAFQTDSLELESLLLPYHVDIPGNGFVCNVEVNRGEVWDNQKTYENAAYFEPVTNGEGFCVLVKKSICEAAGHHIAFMLNEMNLLTYEVSETLSPVTISLENVRPTGATILFHQNKDLIDGRLWCDQEYFLQKSVNGQWENLPRVQEIPFLDHTYDIAMLHHNGVVWEQMYGRLPVGYYRLGKVIPISSGENPEYTTVYAEFSIDNVYTWFDDYSSDVNERIPKDNTLELFGMDGVSLSYRRDNDAIHIITAEGDATIISAEIMIRSAFLTDLTGDGVSEVCATVQTMNGMHIAVYDAAEKKLHELHTGDNSFYLLTKKADRLCVLRKNADWVTQDYGQLSLNGRKGLEIRELDPEVQTLTEKVVSLDISNRKHTSIYLPDQLDMALSTLRDLEQNVQPASKEKMAAAQANPFAQSHIAIHYELGERNLSFSKDFDLVWEYGEQEGYLILDPQPIRELVEFHTDGVLNKEISGEPFATVDTPWNWCKGLTVNAVSTAEIHACLDVSSYGNTTGYLTTNGVVPADSLGNLISVLNQIPADAFTDSGNTSSDYRGFWHEQLEGTTSISIIDGVNQMGVVIRIHKGFVQMILTDELDKTEHDAYTYLSSPATIWTIKDSALRTFLNEIRENPPVIHYSVGSEYQWQDPIDVSADEFSLKLYLIEGWEHAYVKNQTSSGIRCRPEGITEGWIYFSFWPEGHVVKEENRFYSDGSWHGFPSKQSYPSSVSTPEGFNTSDAIWSYKAVYTDIGDFVVINDGADSWFMEYKDQIEDTISLSSFTVE